MTSSSPADAFLAEISDLFTRRGGQHYGEDVTQMEHALQTAHHARLDGASPALVVSALLHDIGHLMQKIGEDAADRGIDTRHEQIGAGFLARGFGPDVTEPIRLHVAAKRYRVAVDPAYASRLSYASQQSLVLQGGPMRPDELKVFLADPYAVAAQRLRDYDEAGKDLDAEVASFDSYTPLLRELIDEAGKL